jgi:hypothetical protein
VPFYVATIPKGISQGGTGTGQGRLPNQYPRGGAVNVLPGDTQTGAVVFNTWYERKVEEVQGQIAEMAIQLEADMAAADRSTVFPPGPEEWRAFNRQFEDWRTRFLRSVYSSWPYPYPR